MSATPAEIATGRRLPKRPALHSGQALDSYLEHLAEANHLRSADLMGLIAAATDTTRFLMLTPSERTLRALHGVTGLATGELRDATLATFDGTLLNLTGLEHDRPSSYRTVAARGWLPGNGTQICPRCLNATGEWQLRWRLPTSTVCLDHHVYLVNACPDCGKPFRSTRHNPLRPIGAATVCGNPHRARGQHCARALTSVHAPVADHGCIDRQTRHDRAVATGTATVLGKETTVADYTRALTSLTTLLLHITTAAVDRRPLPHWARRLNLEHHRRPGRRPRWGIAPPEDTRLRSRTLTAADRVLSVPDLDQATAELSAWTDLIPPTPDGFVGWIGDHTRPDPAVTRIVMATHAPRRRLSRSLDRTGPLVPDLANIPQVVPEALYSRHLTGLFTSRADTVRTFAALCLARAHRNVNTWAEASSALGLPEEVGTKTVGACAAAQTGDTVSVIEAMRALAGAVPSTDYRALEQIVRDFARADDWFVHWVENCRPGTVYPSKRYAVTWLWTRVAGGHVQTSPAWIATPTADRRASYRRFAASLTGAQKRSLREVLAGRPEVSPESYRTAR